MKRTNFVKSITAALVAAPIALTASAASACATVEGLVARATSLRGPASIPQSLVVFDPKGELYELVKKPWVQAHFNRTMIIDAEVLHTDGSLSRYDVERHCLTADEKREIARISRVIADGPA